jgi:hypothetical protein
MKRYLSLILVALYPYLFYFSYDYVYKEKIMKTVFQNNILYLVFALMILYAIALLSSIIVCIVSIVMKWNAQQLLLVNMIIKIFHAPAIIYLSLVTLLFMSIIFTFVVSILSAILLCGIIIMSGLIGLTAVIRSAIEKKLSKKHAIIHGCLQFLVIGDVISSIVIYRRVKKASNMQISS